MQAGDIIIKHEDEHGWSAVKILAIDVWPDDSETFHCLVYAHTQIRPTPERSGELEVMAYHAPIDGADFRREWEVLCSPGVLPEDLVGFHEYLKLTDYPRYAAFTGQDIEALSGKAIQHYQTACALGDEGRREEAIEEYTRAIELFPLFFEAIDNRAFTYMELGQLEPAMLDFEESLRVNPDGHAAFFSRGECLLKLGRYDEAENVFLEGTHRFREHQNHYLHFLELTKRARKHRPSDLATTSSEPQTAAIPVEDDSPRKKRPWWRFWR